MKRIILAFLLCMLSAFSAFGQEQKPSVAPSNVKDLVEVQEDTDSLEREKTIASAQSDFLSIQEHLAILEKRIESIDKKTSDTFWHRPVSETISDTFSFLAALITIAGIVVLAKEYWSRRHNKEYQKLIMEDRIRLLYTNLVSLEVVRLKMEHFAYKDCLPHASIFPRFCFTEKELDMTRFSVSTEKYNYVHRFEKTLRNYNLAAMTAAAHFADKTIPREVKEYDIENLKGRTTRLVSKIIELCGEEFLNLKEIDVENYIKNNYAIRDTFFPDENSWELTSSEQAISGITGVTLIPGKYNVITKIEKDGTKVFKTVQMFPESLTAHFRKAVANRYLTPNDTNVEGPSGQII